MRGFYRFCWQALGLDQIHEIKNLGTLHPKKDKVIGKSEIPQSSKNERALSLPIYGFSLVLSQPKRWRNDEFAENQKIIEKNLVMTA